jgi:hypothetical protein
MDGSNACFKVDRADDRHPEVLLSAAWGRNQMRSRRRDVAKTDAKDAFKYYVIAANRPALIFAFVFAPSRLRERISPGSFGVPLDDSGANAPPESGYLTFAFIIRISSFPTPPSLHFPNPDYAFHPLPREATGFEFSAGF